ncbi:MAG: hypothetical protein CMF59_16225 [Leptospiraceae bacterium]|nr:hypothetical protein [Leptospiraceae bacterium]
MPEPIYRERDSMKHLLIVDDNDKYARILDEYYKNLGYSIDRAVDGASGYSAVKEKGLEHYHVIVTDITMETQMAGLTMLKRLYKDGYRGMVVVASTGFDVPMAKPLTRCFLGRMGIDYLVPKTTVLSGKLEYYPMAFFSKPIMDFREIESNHKIA